MEARELRIGNLIYDYNNRLITVIAIIKEDCYFIECNENHSKYLLEDINPIPLTEDWLEIFGFKYDYGRWEKEYYNEYVFEIEKIPEGCILSINCGEYTEGKPFKHVHQLQNLYFALTGEELTIKI